MVSVLASSVEGCGFDPYPGQTEKYQKIKPYAFRTIYVILVEFNQGIRVE